MRKIFSLKNIPVIISILSALYFSLNVVFNINYSIDCEEFYNIPKRYFSTEMLPKIFEIGALTILYTLPFIILIKKTKSICENKVAFAFYVFTICLSYLFINIIYLANIFSIYCITCFDNYIFLLIFILLNFLLYGYLFYYLKNDIQKTNSINNISGKNKDKIKFTRILFYLALFCFFIILILEIVFPFISPIEKKRKYEFVKINNVKYVVLSHVDDKILIAKYLDVTNTIMIMNKYYYLKNESDDMMYSYRTLHDKPIISYNK